MSAVLEESLRRLHLAALRGVSAGHRQPDAPIAPTPTDTVRSGHQTRPTLTDQEDSGSIEGPVGFSPLPAAARPSFFTRAIAFIRRRL